MTFLVHSFCYLLIKSIYILFISLRFYFISIQIDWIHCILYTFTEGEKAFYIDYENVNIHSKLSKPLQATNQTWIYAIIYSVYAPVQCYRSRFKLVFLNVKLVLLNVVISFSKTRQSLASFCCRAVRLQSLKHLNKVFLKTRIQYKYLPWRKTW